MNKAVPWSSNEVEVDLRGAADQEARREGLSVGEWLDGIIARRAAERGVAPSELSNEDRLAAVTEHLMGLAGDRGALPAPTQKAPPKGDADGRRSRVMLSGSRELGEVRQRIAAAQAMFAKLKPVAPSNQSVAVVDATKPAAAGVEGGTAGVAESESDLGVLSEAGFRGSRRLSAAPAQAGPAPARDLLASEPDSAPDRDIELAPVEPDPRDSAGPSGADKQEPMPSMGPTNDTDQVSKVEAKLTALFHALDQKTEPPAIPSAAPAAQDVAAQLAAKPERSTTRPVLKSAAGSLPESLGRAIAEIAERQAFLDRAAPVAPEAGPALVEAEAGRPAIAAIAGRVAASDLLERFGASRLAKSRSERGFQKPAADLPEQNGAADHSSPGAAVSPAVTDAPLPLATLQGEMAAMARRIEDVHREVIKPRPGPAKDITVDDVRNLLESPDKSLKALEQRVEVLADRIDSAIEGQLKPEAIDLLAQRIEGVHSSLSTQLSSAAPIVVDHGPMEATIQDLVGRIDALRQSSVDLGTLDELMRQLTVKLDDTHPPAGAAVFGELQAQVGKLAERIDRSDAGLTAIVSVERSLGELFTQLEETRDAAINAAEGAARTAARDTLRAAMMDSALSFNKGQGTAESAVEHVTQEIADLRATREAADARLHSMLGTLNKTLEKVVERLAALPPGGGPAQPGADHDRDVLDLADRDATLDLRLPSAGVDLKPSRERSGSAPIEPAMPSEATEEADFPIEPGSGPIHARVGAPKADPAQFIAAARRAAQAAAQEAMSRTDAASAARGKISAQEARPDAAPGVARGTSALATYRRPLLLTLAGLVLLLGAAQVARMSYAPTPSVVASDAGRDATPLDAGVVKAPGSALEQPSVPTVPAGEPEKTADAAATAAPSAGAAPDVGDRAETATEATPAAAPVAASPAAKPLPTLAMGPAANRAAARAAGTDPLQAGIGAGLRELAQDGNAAAQYEIGLRLADGRGVTRDLKGAADWFEKAAKQGLAPAAYRLGSLYEKGLGVTRDPAVSTQWYEKAADQGNIRAMHNLAVMSAEGATGKPDYAKAASWFTKAAKAGVRDSQFNLAILYARGLGVEQSLAQSYTWFAIAAAQGDTDAAKKRDEVAARLDAKVLTKAKADAEQFQAAVNVAGANEVQAPPGGWEAVTPTHGTTSSNDPKGSARVSSR